MFKAKAKDKARSSSEIGAVHHPHIAREREQEKHPSLGVFIEIKVRTRFRPAGFDIIVQAHFE